jgi:uncharacterized membrane protein YgcG
LPAPEGGALREGEQPMRASPGDSQATEEVGRRSPTFRPDRVTQLRGTIGYYEVFTPAITPFKRVTAFDRVALAPDGTPILAIAPSERRRIEPAGADVGTPAGRPHDRFWGSVVLDFSEGRTVPLPSVAPEARVLTLRTEPMSALRLEQDGADNFFATAVGEVNRQVRLVFLMDAPRDYFGANLPTGPVDALAQRVPALPAAVRRDAETFAAELGLSRASSFAAALTGLVGHFRAFEESSQPPRDTGNIYLDLARGMRGICRHRVYAFVITAQALGMHARFVQNEAHAWAEVELPGAGWLRVDLGGAATGLEARNVQDRPFYRPEVPDRLPRPAAYERAYEEARRASGAAGAGRQGGSSARGGSSAQGGSSGAHGALTSSEAPGGGDPSSDPAAPDGGPEPVPPTLTSGPDGRTLRALSIALDRRSHEVFRGRELEVTGVVRAGADGVAGLRVETLLRASRGTAEWLLGVTVTREAGDFRGVFGVPPDLPVGDYRLLVRTPGNAQYAPGQAQ